MRVALVGCSASKLDHAAPARELYTGALFKASLRYSERVADHVFVVSAKHMLVDLSRVLEPYDWTMADWEGESMRSWWAWEILHELDTRLCAPVSVSVLAGEAYAKYLRAEGEGFTKRRGWPALTFPLHGLQIGRRLAWLARETRALEAV